MPHLRALALLALVALSACETIEGAGRDIGTAGDVIAQESRDVQAGN
ncbi:MAG: hypothetical protein RLZZ437_2942 [Pseudomonadota bacterium]|jgi:predicted small secreted protein